MLKRNTGGLYEKDYVVQPGLESLIARLVPGMQINGRIVDVVGENRYLLRIRGYNILTDSAKQFRKFDEVALNVIQTSPHLILDLLYKLEERTVTKKTNTRTDIVA